MPQTAVLLSTNCGSIAVPEFLAKLWKMIEDDKFHSCIAWNRNGFSFRITDSSLFSRDVLPAYFKHSNVNSFVRQLNMYGFRKVADLEKGTLKNPIDQDSLEFEHPYFVRDHPELLTMIKRKNASARLTGSEPPKKSDPASRLEYVLSELQRLRNHQASMNETYMQLTKENKQLLRELELLRTAYTRQLEITKVIARLLLSCMPSHPGGRFGDRELISITSPRAIMSSHEDVSPIDRLKSSKEFFELLYVLQNQLHGPSSRPVISDVTDELNARTPAPSDLDYRLLGENIAAERQMSTDRAEPSPAAADTFTTDPYVVSSISTPESSNANAGNHSASTAGNVVEFEELLRVLGSSLNASPEIVPLPDGGGCQAMTDLPLVNSFDELDDFIPRSDSDDAQQEGSNMESAFPPDVVSDVSTLNEFTDFTNDITSNNEELSKMLNEKKSKTSHDGCIVGKEVSIYQPQKLLPAYAFPTESQRVSRSTYREAQPPCASADDSLVQNASQPELFFADESRDNVLSSSWKSKLSL